MGLFSRAEKTLFLGTVIRDFGVLSEYKIGFTRFKVSLLLCEKNGRSYLVSKQSARALLSASVTYHYVYQENLAKLKQAVDESVQLTE